MAYFFLALAIMIEIIGTNFLKASAGFTKLYPAFVGIGCFALALYFMTLSFKTIPLSMGYAIWSGVGTAGTAIIGVLLWKEKINVYGLAGIAFVIFGIILLNLSAPSTS